MKNVLLLLLLSCTLCNAQKTFTVLDSVTREPLPYIDVNLLNGYGIYTDAAGSVRLNDTGVIQVELSGIGYRTKKVTLNTVTGEVLLAPEPITLDVLIIPAGKAETKKIKAKGHQREADMAVSRIGQEYALFIPGGTAESYITTLSLPLMQNDFVVSTDYKATVFEENVYRALVKIEFLPVVNNAPGEARLYDIEEIALIDGTSSPKLFEHILAEQALLPAEGLFVKLTILGSADENGNLNNELPYYLVQDRDGKQTRRMKQMQPNFPLYEIKKGAVPAYTSVAFVPGDTWRAISHPLMFNPAKKYNGFTINIGYTLKTYK